jgi:hypothetical protein
MTTDHIKMLQATVDTSRATVYDNGNISIGKPVSEGEIVLKPSNGTEILRITNTGFIYMGKTIEDAGEAYKIFMSVMGQFK